MILAITKEEMELVLMMADEAWEATREDILYEKDLSEDERERYMKEFAALNKVKGALAQAKALTF